MRPIRWSVCVHLSSWAPQIILRVSRFNLRLYDRIARSRRRRQSPPSLIRRSAGLNESEWPPVTGVGSSADRWIVCSLSTHARLSSIDHTWSQIDHSRLLARSRRRLLSNLFLPSRLNYFRFRRESMPPGFFVVRLWNARYVIIFWRWHDARVKRLINLSAKGRPNRINTTDSILDISNLADRMLQFTRNRSDWSLISLCLSYIYFVAWGAEAKIRK